MVISPGEPIWTRIPWHPGTTRPPRPMSARRAGDDGRPPLVYLPGLDGTGRLLHRQPQLHDSYKVRSVAYPQDDVHTYKDLSDRAVAALDETGPGVALAESFGGAVALLAA